MTRIQGTHHVALICFDYEASKKFNTELLGLSIAAEYYRPERQSWKPDLSLQNNYVLELFSFPAAPPRVSQPEARGLRHLAFSVKDITAIIAELNKKGVTTEPVRADEYTGKHFTFFSHPDGLPLELYEI